MEYIPNMKMMDLETYTPERMERFIQGMRSIHAAHVEHGDPMPRNMMIVENRVLWIDFDRAITYDQGSLSSKEVEDLDHEMVIVEELDSVLVRTSKRAHMSLLTESLPG